MNFGKYARYGIVTLCGLLVFFLGSSLPFQTDFMALISLFAIVLLTVAMSYGNRTPIGGLFFGLFTATSFLLGFFLMACVWELSTSYPYVIGPIGKEWGLFLLMEVLASYGPGMVSAVSAFASIGLFFGLLGYVFGHISLHVSVTQPRIFRDYWSSIHLLGKSDRREYSQFDRKLSSWSLKKKRWWKTLLEKVTEPKPDLVFVPHRTKKSAPEIRRGDVFDLSAGRMIGSDFIDPADLTSRHRPLVLKGTEISAKPTGIRRLALEGLLAKFLKWLIPSRVIWIFYLSLSALLVFSVYLVWAPKLSEYAYPGVEYAVVASAAIASVVTLSFVWRWRIVSRELLLRRPDERVLIFFVYLILALLYGFYFEVIVNPPTIPEGWVGSWLIWTRWLLILTIILGFGYICIHRECEVVNTYFYDNSTPASDVSRVYPFKKTHDEPFWLKDEKVKAYWVLRFMYFWRYEVTKIPHSDWERVEVWVDATRGTVKWIVSDYHYRELWYKVKGDLPMLYVNFFINFHTPVPVADLDEVQSISRVFSLTTGNLLKVVVTGEAPEIVRHLRDHLEVLPKSWTDLHPPDWIQDYGLPNVAAKFCSELPWTFWRYPHGLEEAERYLEEPAAMPEDQPKLVRENKLKK